MQGAILAVAIALLEPGSVRIRHGTPQPGAPGRRAGRGRGDDVTGTGQDERPAGAAVPFYRRRGPGAAWPTTTTSCQASENGGTLPVMEITLVKAAGPGDRDRAYLEVAGVTRRGPVHVVHDLPHLVVESLFGINDGLWGELAAGSHPAAGHAATARDPRRQKHGRIVSGAAAGVPAGQWLSPGHQLAKTITNCVASRWGDGPDTPGGVRDRAARENSKSLQELLARVNDETIAMAIRGVRDLAQRWIVMPPGAKLRLSWPLERVFFAGAPAGNPSAWQ